MKSSHHLFHDRASKGPQPSTGLTSQTDFHVYKDLLQTGAKIYFSERRFRGYRHYKNSCFSFCVHSIIETTNLLHLRRYRDWYI